VSPAPRAIRDPRAQALQGTRAGVVPRLLADLVDCVAVFLIYLAGIWTFAIVRALATGHHTKEPTPEPWLTAVLLVVIAFVYLGSAWSGTGRTLGAQFFGLRVVAADGSWLETGRAFGRALVCILMGWLGLLWLVFSRRNLALHDHVCRTAVVYDWNPGTRPVKALESRP
jgi:uncharacterized RDD family membrane protein YckC